MDLTFLADAFAARIKALKLIVEDPTTDAQAFRAASDEILYLSDRSLLVDDKVEIQAAKAEAKLLKDQTLAKDPAIVKPEITQ